MPIHCCAPGKAILTFLPDDTLDAILPRLKFEKHTEPTLVSHEALLVELERVRARGYALDRGEHFDGIHCVAAPLLDRHGQTIAAITIAGPARRLPVSRFEELGRTIIHWANEAARRFQE